MLSMIRPPTSSMRRVLSRTSTPLARSYHENILDHYENPRNVGSFDKKLKNIGTGLVGAPACGDVMKLQFEVDDNGVITDAKFKTFGCGSAIASSSVCILLPLYIILCTSSYLASSCVTFFLFFVC
jgi:hypothetical protein